MRFTGYSWLTLLLLLVWGSSALSSMDQPLAQARTAATQPGDADVDVQVATRPGKDSASDPGLEEPTARSAADSDQATLDFVREHQPELAKLIEFLKAKQGQDYREAMAESAKVRHRLQTIKDRDRELYEVELAIWKNAAQLRLWAASLSARSKELDDRDRSKLREFVTRENELTVQRLHLEKVRVESRLAQLSQQLAKRQEQSDSVIAKGLKMWEHRIEKSGSKSKRQDDRLQ